METDFIDDNDALLVSYIPRVSLGVNLPRVELQLFNGRPTIYWEVIRQSRNYVAEKTCEGGQRLLYLLHHCGGEADECHAPTGGQV